MSTKHSALLAECARFRGGFSTLVMATVSADGVPEASYAPYVDDRRGFLYVFISDLSRHTANLRDVPRASLLFIENEEHAENPHARRRLTIGCSCSFLPRDEPAWGSIMDSFRERFGDLIDILRSLDDFHLVRLGPQSATYVRGFAQAYELSGADLQRMGQMIERAYRPAGPDSPRVTPENADGD